MHRRAYFYVFVFCLIFIVSCSRDYSTLDALAQNPEWLTQLIAEIENEKYYAGAVIYRHQWHSKFYYHLMVPLDSCAYCRAYDTNGNIIEWTNESFQDYLENRKNEVVIWGYGD